MWECYNIGIGTENTTDCGQAANIISAGAAGMDTNSGYIAANYNKLCIFEKASFIPLRSQNYKVLICFPSLGAMALQLQFEGHSWSQAPTLTLCVQLFNYKAQNFLFFCPCFFKKLFCNAVCDGSCFQLLFN